MGHEVTDDEVDARIGLGKSSALDRRLIEIDCRDPMTQAGKLSCQDALTVPTSRTRPDLSSASALQMILWYSMLWFQRFTLGSLIAAPFVPEARLPSGRT